MFDRRCHYLPWHKPDTKSVQRISPATRYYRCTCGREWVINTDVRCVLSWDDVAELYGDDRLNEQTGWRRPIRAAS